MYENGGIIYHLALDICRKQCRKFIPLHCQNDVSGIDRKVNEWSLLRVKIQEPSIEMRGRKNLLPFPWNFRSCNHYPANIFQCAAALYLQPHTTIDKTSPYRKSSILSHIISGHKLEKRFQFSAMNLTQSFSNDGSFTVLQWKRTKTQLTSLKSVRAPSPLPLSTSALAQSWTVNSQTGKNLESYVFYHLYRMLIKGPISPDNNNNKKGVYKLCMNRVCLAE